MMMDTMRINQGYSSEGSFNIFFDEKSNIDATRFFELLKDYDESLWDWFKIHNKLSVISQVFIIKSDYGLSEADYNSIIE
jgi:hypothetical protein